MINDFAKCYGRYMNCYECNRKQCTVCKLNGDDYEQGKADERAETIKEMYLTLANLSEVGAK